MVFANLLLTDLGAILQFLSSMPGPSGESALAFVLSEWLDRGHVFYGVFDNKVRQKYYSASCMIVLSTSG